MWQERARESRATLVEQYFDERTGLFRIGPGRARRLAARLPWGVWHYWWQAHALEVLLDGHEAGDPAAGSRAVRLIQAVIHRNGGDLTINDYYDDLAWMGLATLRAHTMGLADERIALSLANAVEAGWDTRHGGFRWRVGDEFRNVAASAPAAMLLAGAGLIEGDARRLGLARQASDWLHATLVEPTGIVWDGCRTRDGVLVPEGRLWSYNVGTVAGLDVVLAGMPGVEMPGMGEPCVGDPRWLLSRAARVVRAGTAALRAGCAGVEEAVALLAAGVPGDGASGGVWRDELGDGAGADPQLFRGILAKYATDLVVADPSHTGDIAGDLIVQARAAWAARDGRGRLRASWAGDPTFFPPPVRAPTLAAHLSGALTLGSVARLERAGLI